MGKIPQNKANVLPGEDSGGTGGQCIVCTRGIRIVCTRGTGSSLHAGLFCPGSFVHAVLTAMHKKGQGR